MDTNAESFYWNDDDKKDQKFRREINEGKVYTERARCDRCGDPLEGRGSQCGACELLLCSNCIGGDGLCEGCSGSGREILPED